MSAAERRRVQTECFDIADLKGAKALLGELPENARARQEAGITIGLT